MIKKLLSTILLVSGLMATHVVAQCIPDVSCVPPTKTFGICPDSTVGIAIGKVGVAYSATLSVKVPLTGADFKQPDATVDSLKITGIDDLAPGLTYQCVPANCKFPGGTQGCILISGTPTQVWDKKIIVKFTVYGKLFGFPAAIPQTNNSYKSIITGPSGIKDLDLAKFDVDQNSPNPFSEKSIINFSSVNNSTVEFKVYNLLGKVVLANTIKSNKGINTITLEANTFAPGIYVYSLKNNDRTITKRMIVSNK